MKTINKYIDTFIMKKFIYAPIPEQQIIYIDGECAVISGDKVIYLKVNELEDMCLLYSILEEWNLGENNIEKIMNYIFEIRDEELNC